MKVKRGEKGRFFLLFLTPTPFSQKGKLKEKRKKKREEKKEKMEENMRFQGHVKEKDLAHHEDEQGLKLCVFILGKRQTFLPQRA